MLSKAQEGKVVITVRIHEWDDSATNHCLADVDALEVAADRETSLHSAIASGANACSG
jgi:hypothetical protein